MHAPSSRSGTYALLRFGRGQWPPASRVACTADALRFMICNEYQMISRGAWSCPSQHRHAPMGPPVSLPGSLTGVGRVLDGLTIGDIDRNMGLRGSKLTRISLKCKGKRLRSLLRYLHRTSRVCRRPVANHPARLYAYGWVFSEPVGEAILSYLRSGQPRPMLGKSSSLHVRPIASPTKYTAWFGGGFDAGRQTPGQLQVPRLPSCSFERLAARGWSEKGNW